MRFQLDHDWQGNMSAPRAQLGDAAKTQLLLLLCAIWIFVGLIGHAPWKPLESTSISIVKSILHDGNWIAPLANGESQLESPPLYYLTAAMSAKLLSPILPMHDGARLFNLFWLTILLLMVGMTGRELWSQGVGRHATFIMIGTVGLVMTAHSLNNEIAAFSAVATGFYALALAKRRPRRASVLLGFALGLGFLLDGLVPLLVLVVTAITLFVLFKNWRTRRFFMVLFSAIFIATPFIVIWLMAFQHYYPALFNTWSNGQLTGFNRLNHLYFLRILIWYAWPALPLALLGLWRFRTQLFIQARFQLIFTFFMVAFLLLGLTSANRDINALPLLLPLVALGAGSVENLKRDIAAALSWFGVMLFGIIGALIWLGWIAMMTGFPEKLQERMRFLSGAYSIDFSWYAFILSFIISLIWLVVSIRAKLSKRSTVTNWAIGMTFVWSLLMTLWLPMIDHAKSYESVFLSAQKAFPKKYTCINSLNVGRAQGLLFDYYTHVTLQPLGKEAQLTCDLYLLQDEKGVGKMMPSQEWQLIWQGKRAADRKESFRLFQLFKP